MCLEVLDLRHSKSRVSVDATRYWRVLQTNHFTRTQGCAARLIGPLQGKLASKPLSKIMQKMVVSCSIKSIIEIDAALRCLSRIRLVYNAKSTPPIPYNSCKCSRILGLPIQYVVPADTNNADFYILKPPLPVPEQQVQELDLQFVAGSEPLFQIVASCPQLPALELGLDCPPPRPPICSSLASSSRG